MYIKNFDRFFSPHQWLVISKAVQVAGDRQWRAFAVGGIVRDAVLWLQQEKAVDVILQESVSASPKAVLKTPNYPKDIDLVFDGGEGAGLEVAIALHQYFPESKLQIHEKFQTAELLWEGSSTGFAMDLATAREEHYAYAGANPEVIATDLWTDLYRRDFTINALALSLSSVDQDSYEIIDLFGGLSDLQAQQVRAIREGSFVEDPRRLFRAVRFAVRLGLKLAPETRTEILHTTASGIHDAIGGMRLRSELIYTLAEAKSGQMFALLQELGALRCIHPDLCLPSDANSFAHQWRRSQYWLKQLYRLYPHLLPKSYVPKDLSSSQDLNFGLLGLELLLSYLPPHITKHLELNLTPEQQNRQIKVADLREHLPPQNAQDFSISAITNYLQRFDPITIILVAAQSSPYHRRILWQYLTHWQAIKSPLTGSDLLELGYRSGKEVGEILHKLRSATLDGIVTSRDEAIAYLNQSYSIPK
ncbi:MAG: hypothetical protein NW214_04460 [Pseudanabaenaceae cyanobacterium bins.39]|nr:hypothetical protein [Pseudanabaenaceae cyanobacterium bins.39]